MKWLTAYVVLCCGLGATQNAGAAEVRWLGPPDCVDSRGTVEEAERLVGRALSSVNVGFRRARQRA
jgi:hypothetical protein